MYIKRFGLPQYDCGRVEYGFILFYQSAVSLVGSALLRAFEQSARILLAPPKQRHRDSPQEPLSTRQLIRHRLEQWKNGHTRQLWHAVTQRARRAKTRRKTTPSDTPQQPPAGAKASPRLCIYKAMRALKSSRIREPTPPVRGPWRRNSHNRRPPLMARIHCPMRTTSRHYQDTQHSRWRK